MTSSPVVVCVIMNLYFYTKYKILNECHTFSGDTGSSHILETFTFLSTSFQSDAFIIYIPLRCPSFFSYLKTLKHCLFLLLRIKVILGFIFQTVQALANAVSMASLNTAWSYVASKTKMNVLPNLLTGDSAELAAIQVCMT